MKIKLLALLTLLIAQGLSAVTWDMHNQSPIPITWKLSLTGCADEIRNLEAMKGDSAGVGWCITNRIMVTYHGMPGGMGKTESIVHHEIFSGGNHLTFDFTPKVEKGKVVGFVPTLFLGRIIGTGTPLSPKKFLDLWKFYYEYKEKED